MEKPEAKVFENFETIVLGFEKYEASPSTSGVRQRRRQRRGDHLRW